MVDPGQISPPVIRASGVKAFTGSQSMDGHKLTNLANGSNPGDAVNVSQLSATVVPSYWKEMLLSPNQQVNIGGPSAGIAPLQILKLTAPLAAGCILKLRAGGATYTFTEGVDFFMTGAINSDIAALWTVISTVCLGVITPFIVSFYAIDPVNNILMLATNFIETDFAIWDGVGGFNGLILDSGRGPRVYESIAADLIILPVVEPVGSNAGFYRLLTRDNVPEAHPNRHNTAVYFWGTDGNWTAV